MRTTIRVGGVATLSLIVLGAAPWAYAAAGQAWLIDGGELVVTVPVEPGGAFEARASSLTGRLTPGSSTPLELAGEVSIDLARIDTGIALRNEHMRDRLQLSRGPGFAKAVLSELVLSAAADPSFRGETEFTGALLFHGVSRPVSGKAKIQAAGVGVRVEASFVLELPGFGIEPPNYMGVGVTNKLLVNVSFSTVPEGRSP